MEISMIDIPFKSLKKGLYFTDIHFGRKSNSPEHNQDCLNFINWLTSQVRNDPEIDYIAFLGDWHESRTALDISTMNYSYEGGKNLNNIGLPVFFLIGNHDMGSRFARDIYSTINFNEFSNFIVISEGPYVSPYHINNTLFVPFLSKDEYENLNDYNGYDLWAGHFEFKDFILTGYSVTLDHGPDITDFDSVSTILSGHFHKRQNRKNTHYIGNCFPMDFGDANDFKRGIAIFNHEDNTIKYIDWKECPKYIRCNLSSLLDEEIIIHNNSFVEIDLDIEITYQHLVALEESLRTQYQIRSLYMDESSKFILDSSTDESIKLSQTEFESISTDDLIVQLLNTVESKTLDSKLLIQTYRDLK